MRRYASIPRHKRYARKTIRRRIATQILISRTQLRIALDVVHSCFFNSYQYIHDFFIIYAIIYQTLGRRTRKWDRELQTKQVQKHEYQIPNCVHNQGPRITYDYQIM